MGPPVKPEDDEAFRDASADRPMHLISKIARFALGLLLGLALIASPVAVLVASLTFVFIAGTSPSDPDEKDLPVFALFGVIALATGLMAFWSAVLPGRGRPWRLGLTLITALLAAFCITAMWSIRSDPDARLGSKIAPVAASRTV